MKRYCYLNGKIIPEKEAKISINDVGLLRSYAVFEFIKTVNGKPFLFEEHYNRLINSAKSLCLKVPLTQTELEKQIEKLRRKNNFEETTVKFVLTGGESEDGITCDFETPNFFILMRKFPEIPEKLYTKGVKLITHDHKRENSSSKTTSYLTRLKLQKEKDRRSAFEILYVHDGKVFEGATCNFFLFRGNKLITTKDGILKGTTRDLIIELAEKNFQVEERKIKVSEIQKADEAFTTATLRGVVPVVKIDNQKIGDGKVGKKTKKLLKLYKERLEKV